MSKNNVLVSTINGAGSAIETIYVLIFIIYAPKKEKARVLGLLTLVMTIFTGVALVSLFALHGNARKLFCGCAAAVFSIIMYGSPLSIMVSQVTLKFFTLLCKLLDHCITGFILVIKSSESSYYLIYFRVLWSGSVN